MTRAQSFTRSSKLSYKPVIFSLWLIFLFFKVLLSKMAFLLDWKKRPINKHFILLGYTAEFDKLNWCKKIQTCRTMDQ